MNNQKWQIVDKFLNKYKDEDYFIGAILSGSYAAGNGNENSDIDIYIIANDSINFRERGMKLIDGQLVEYFINPVRQIKKYLEEEQDNKDCLDIRLLSNCKIIIDKTGEVQDLVETAKRILNKGPKKLDEYTYAMNCYMVWSRFDELELKYKRKEDTDFNYSLFLEQVIYSYFQNKQIFLVNMCKIEFILKDEEFKKNYNVGKILDKKFLDLLSKSFNEKDYNKKFECASNLYYYFKNEFNDFDINNFNIRDSIE